MGLRTPGSIIQIPRELLPRYRFILELKDPQLARRFDARLTASPGSAHLEALTYSLLEGPLRLHPEIEETAGGGGPDFKLSPAPSTPVYVECKHLDQDSVSEQTGIQHESFAAGPYSLITEKIGSAIGDCVRQLSRRTTGPGLAVIGSNHSDAYHLLGAYEAETVLRGTTHLRTPINRPPSRSRIQEVAPLRDSAFLRPPRGRGMDIDRRRLPVSAVLLVAFNFEARWAQALGILNPWPNRPFDYRLLPGIPFARFKKTPRITQWTVPPVEWVIDSPEPRRFEAIQPPDLPETQLREGPPTPLR
jgi:hypothetical protein